LAGDGSGGGALAGAAPLSPPAFYSARGQEPSVFAWSGGIRPPPFGSVFIKGSRAESRPPGGGPTAALIPRMGEASRGRLRPLPTHGSGLHRSSAPSGLWRASWALLGAPATDRGSGAPGGPGRPRPADPGAVSTNTYAGWWAGTPVGQPRADCPTPLGRGDRHTSAPPPLRSGGCTGLRRQTTQRRSGASGRWPCGIPAGRSSLQPKCLRF